MKRGQRKLPFLFFGGAQQDDQRALAAVVRPGLAIGQDFLALGQPAADQLAQDREFLRRSVALAMDDPNAALAAVQAFGQESGQLVPGFVPVQSVQIQFGLDHPATTPQIAQDAGCQSLAQVVWLIATFQPVLQADLAVQAFMQGGTFVVDELLRTGRGCRATEMDAVGRGDGLDAGHGDVESALVWIHWQGAGIAGRIPVRRQGVFAMFVLRSCL